MGISVLVADDEKELAESVGLLLREFGYEVYEALDGTTAVNLLEEKKPDVLILDLNMPRVSGEEVLRKISSLGLKTKVIVSTGYPEAEKEFRSRVPESALITAFLEKPISIHALDDAIKRAVREA